MCASSLNYHFTEEDGLTSERMQVVRSSLSLAGHRVTHGPVDVLPSPGTDIWMYGIGWDPKSRFEPDVVERLLRFPGKLAVFQVCDAKNLWLHRIPQSLIDRADLFLRNHWPASDEWVDANRYRIGWLPPMMRAMKARRGSELAQRRITSIFYGTRTGVQNMADGSNAREELVRRMRASGIAFEGGLTPNSEPVYRPAPDLVVPRIRGREHDRKLANTMICLAPWGNHPLTYRFFEGLALRCLVIAQSLSDVEFLAGRIRPGVHYVEVAADLSNLIDVVRYYCEHPDEAQAIADAGHQHYIQYLEPGGRLLSPWVFQATVESWKSCYRTVEVSRVADWKNAIHERVRAWRLR